MRGNKEMRVTEKLTKQVTEVKYLNAENVDRYRAIMRIFYENYEKLNYWLYQEDVYKEMINDPYFVNYEVEQCQQDLSSLAEWRNLLTIQDTGKVSSIQEFKNKKFRYQMSEYSVEIERLVQRLENLFIEGASLEPTLLERIRKSLEQCENISEKDSNTVFSWWNDLNNDFIRLNQNYQDYIRDLNSLKAEEMMRTREFLVFKDKLVEYLRSFIKGLQRNIGVIEESMQQTNPHIIEMIIEKVVQYELLIPRIDIEVTYELLEEKARGRFQSIYNWFVGSNGQENESGKLLDATSEIIRRITRYATQLSEKSAMGANRREEYRKICSLFSKCADIEEAHKMSAMVFGIERPFHLKGELVRKTESMNGTVYEEEPLEIILKPMTRTYKEKVNRSAIKDRSVEKEETRKKMVKQLKEDQKQLEELKQDGKINFQDLPVIEPRVRGMLLKWLSDALEDPKYTGRTDDGSTYFLDMTLADSNCVVHCKDGNFTMPQISIVFQEE